MMPADPGNILPKDPSRTYDVKQVVTAITDPGSFFETQPCFSKNIVTGFARLQGASIGIVANQPKVLAGSLDLDAADKAARFIRFCDAFHIPILTLVDVPGFLPGRKPSMRELSVTAQSFYMRTLKQPFQKSL